jgi:hypothetical protein
MITAALTLLTQIPAHAAYPARLLPLLLLLFGIGGGLTLPAVTTLGMAGAILGVASFIVAAVALRSGRRLGEPAETPTVPSTEKACSTR